MGETVKYTELDKICPIRSIGKAKPVACIRECMLLAIAPESGVPTCDISLIAGALLEIAKQLKESERTRK